MTHVGGLAAGSTYQATGLFTVPYNLAGSYYVFVVSDVYNQVPSDDSSSTHSNLQVTPIQVSAYTGGGTIVQTGTGTTPPADLVTSNVTAPVSITAGYPVTVTWQVQNTGANATSASQWLDHVYLSDHNGITGNNVTNITSVTHTGALAVEGSYTGTTTFTVPQGISGTYYVIVVSDPEGQVFEGTADQSTKTSSTSFTINAPVLPALIVGSLTAPVTTVGRQQRHRHLDGHQRKHRRNAAVGKLLV